MPNLLKKEERERERERRPARYLRKLKAHFFRLGSALFRGSGLSHLPLVKSVREKLVRSLKQDIPDSVIIDRHTIFLDPNDRLELSLRWIYESFETEIFKKLICPGDVVLDVGAHIGYHTLTAARLVGKSGRVFAFEPDPVNFPILEKNIAANKYTNIVPVRKGVSGTTRKEIFYFYGDRAGSLIKDDSKMTDSPIEIDVISLDDFIGEGRVDFIKIDVDGGERLVIQGMRNTLKRSSLAILIEHNLGSGAEEDFMLLQSNGFEVYSLHYTKNEMVKISSISEAIGRNFLCVKGQKAQLLKKLNLIQIIPT